MRVKLLYQVAPVWQVGEVRPAGTDWKQLAVDHERLRASEHYPGDYHGRVISCIPAACEYSPADTADPHRRVIPLDLTDDELVAVKSRRLKFGGYGLQDVTFDDRHGAVVPKLRELYPDPEAFEREEAAAVEAARAANIAEKERYHLESMAHRIAREEYAKALVAYDPDLGGEAPLMPERPKAATFIDRSDGFLEQAAAIAKALPKTVTHTGAGLYKVQAAGTMATPAHLWAMETVDPTDEGDPGGNDGTGSNVTVVGGQIGSALDFNGNNSNVNCGDVTELNSVQKFSIAFRMNQDPIDQTDIIFQKRVNDLIRIRIRTASTGRFEININDGSTHQGWFDYSTVITAGSWHHVAVVFDGSQTGDANRLKAYVDGIPVVLTFSDGIPALSPALATADAIIGYTSTAFDGTLDDFRIYADALTDAQIKVLAGRGLAHWDTISAFDENLLLESERFDEASWLSIAGPVITPNTDVAPNGQTTADTVADENATAYAYIYQNVTVPNDANWVHGSVYIKKDSDVSRFPEFYFYLTGGVFQYFRVQLNTSTGATVIRGSDATYTVNVTSLSTYWRLELGILNNASGNTTSHLRINPALTTTWGVSEVAATGSIVVWGAQITLLTLQAYKPTREAADTSVTLTTGGLTDGERDGEAFVSGGNTYGVIRAGTDSVLVVGDATGESGACSISPYSQIQSGADQSWADQGGTTFTETQYVRVFAGTYDENLEPNAGLTPAYGEYALIIEGDPTDDRDNIVLAPSSGIAFQAAGPDYLTLRHMKVVSASAGTFCVYFKVGSLKCAAVDLHVVSDDLDPIYMIYQGEVKECRIDQTRDAAGVEGIYLTAGGLVVNCTVTNSAPTTRGDGIWISKNETHVEGCAIAGYDNGIEVYDGKAANNLVVKNVTIYNCDQAVALGTYVKSVGLRMLDCILSSVGTCIRVGAYPEEAGGLFGPAVLMRNNCFHSYTTFADDGSTTKTYAEFIALSRCDAKDDKDATDPLLTDPAAHDFSLQYASPCKWTGHGSAVIQGVNLVAFDAHCPDIGAWSSGTSSPVPPSISVADDGTGTSFTITIAAADEAADHYACYRRSDLASPTLWPTPKTGSGTLQITGLGVYGYQVMVRATRTGDPCHCASRPAVDYVSVTAGSPPAAAGGVSLPLENIRNLLANSTSFQALVSAANPTEAKTKIHYPALDEASWSRPRALIGHVAPAPRHAIAGRGAGNNFAESGSAEIRIEADIGGSYQAAGQEENAYLEFANVLGAIMSEMEALAGTSGYLDAYDFEMGPIVRSAVKKETLARYWYRARLTLRWGVRG